MDFWEGALLGPIWVQTDYQDRKHRGFYFAVGICCLASLLAYLFVPSLTPILSFSPYVYLGVSAALLVLLPFAASRYRSFPLIARIFILLAYILQYLAAWAFVVKLFSIKTNIDPMEIFMDFGHLANNIMGAASSFFAFLGGLSATLVGMIVGALLLGLAGLLALIVATYLPLLYLFLIKKLQRLVDALILHSFFKEHSASS
ncbi:MAG: hypothetical protein Q4E09_03515 [Eubacteriales bacterium]|nr:hypothetical protein [Eubacteriales bacterium]